MLKGPKRTRESIDGADSRDDQQNKKRKSGFSVGPDNLPDGVHRRKVQKIKKSLIHKAKVRKEYAKVKLSENERMRSSAAAVEDTTEIAGSSRLHPERQAMLEVEEPEEQERTPDVQETSSQYREPRRKHSKFAPFTRETQEAERRKAEVERRQVAIEEATQQRKIKAEQRERSRNAMAKARVRDSNGQRKLGRESQILLEKAQRLMAK